MKNLVILASAVFLFSCSPVEKDVVINSIWGDTVPAKALSELAHRFQTRHPDIKVTIHSFSDFEFKKNLPAWFKDANPPDLITWVAGTRMKNLAQGEVLAPLDHLFGMAPFEETFPKVFKDSSSYEGRIYFMPQSWYWWAVYYRPSLFEEYEIRRAPKTWMEFLEVCEKLKAQGVPPISLGVKDDPWTVGGWIDYLNFRTNGGAFHSQLLKGEVPYTHPQVASSFSLMKDLMIKGYVIPDFNKIGWKESAHRVFEKKAAMVFLGQFINDIAPEDIKEDLDFFQFPAVKGTSLFNDDFAWEDTPIDGYVKLKNAPHPQAADLFLLFLMEAESQEFWANSLGRVAANKAVPAPGLSVRKGQKMALSASGVFQFFDRDTPTDMGFPGMSIFIGGLEKPSRWDDMLNDLENLRHKSYSYTNTLTP